MSPEQFGLILIVLCSAVEALSQMCFKMQILRPKAKKMWIALGAGLFAFQAIFYTRAITFLDINVAYPLSALCSVAVVFLSIWLLKERMDVNRWLGVTLIICGCLLVSL